MAKINPIPPSALVLKTIYEWSYTGRVQIRDEPGPSFAEPLRGAPLTWVMAEMDGCVPNLLAVLQLLRDKGLIYNSESQFVSENHVGFKSKWRLPDGRTLSIDTRTFDEQVPRQASVYEQSQTDSETVNETWKCYECEIRIDGGQMLPGSSRGRFPFPEQMVRLTREGIEEVEGGLTDPRAKPGVTGGRGRKRGSVTTDPDKEANLADRWMASGEPTYASFAARVNTSDEPVTAIDVARAVDNTRKRRKEEPVKRV